MHAIEDELTGVRNRRQALLLLTRQVMVAAERTTTLGVLVIDVDGFARINAVHGYECGDEVLRHLARQIQSVARPQDYVARVGDDRFVLILPGVMNAGHAELAAHKLLRLLEVPIKTRQTQVRIHATVGAALCPAHASHPDFLLRQAEDALRRARRDGISVAFPPRASGDLELSELWDLEMQLGGAIERGEIMMNYQPQIDARTGRAVGAEALMRWVSPSRGVVTPALFIPVAERTGQIKKLTIWALNTALRQAGQWPVDEGQRVSVSVNLPGALAMQADLPELVESALKLWGRDHVQLILEITESTLMDPATAFPVLERIREAGVQIAIDDFGTGYSCLAYFRNIPVDELKVDRSFVAALGESANADLVGFIVQLAHRFGLRVAAEGVEDGPTRDVLAALGCDVLQGYLYGKPMPAAEFSTWLAQRATRGPELLRT